MGRPVLKRWGDQALQCLLLDWILVWKKDISKCALAWEVCIWSRYQMISGIIVHFIRCHKCSFR